MRLYHKQSGKIHAVSIGIDLKFYSSDFILGTKSIIPIQVGFDAAKVSGDCSFYCYDCGKAIPIEELFSKCFKCGEFLPIEQLMGHKQSGLIFCVEDSESGKEEKDTPRPLVTFVETYSINK